MLIIWTRGEWGVGGAGGNVAPTGEVSSSSTLAQVRPCLGLFSIVTTLFSFSRFATPPLLLFWCLIPHPCFTLAVFMGLYHMCDRATHHESYRHSFPIGWAMLNGWYRLAQFLKMFLSRLIMDCVKPIYIYIILL